MSCCIACHCTLNKICLSFFFHLTNVFKYTKLFFSNFDGDPNNLELGQEVEYNLGTRGSSGSCSSAENVRILTKGTIVLPAISGEILDGTVTRPLRSVNPDQMEYSGLIRVNGENNEDYKEYEFGIMGLLNKRELLQVGDPVQLQVCFKIK